MHRDHATNRVISSNSIAWTAARSRSISIAIDKAFTGAVARRGTHVYNELCVPGKPTFGIHISNEGHFSIIGGGLPVWVNGEIVGGIGVSSGSAEQDQVCAEAGIAYFYAKTGMKA